MKLIKVENTRDARIWHDASSAYFEQGKDLEALQCALQAVDLGEQVNKPSPWHVRHCARLLVDAGMPGLALAIIVRSEKSDPDHLTCLQKARALKSMRKLDAAIEVLSRAAKTSDKTYRDQIIRYYDDLMQG